MTISDNVLTFLYIVIIAVIVGVGIIYVINKKLQSVSINLPKFDFPKPVVKINIDKNGKISDPDEVLEGFSTLPPAPTQTAETLPPQPISTSTEPEKPDLNGRIRVVKSNCPNETVNKHSGTKIPERWPINCVQPLPDPSEYYRSRYRAIRAQLDDPKMSGYNYDQFTHMGSPEMIGASLFQEYNDYPVGANADEK